VGVQPDVLIVGGDANDGQDPKGRDVEVDNVPWQISEAEALLLEWQPKRIEVLAGTAYHTGDTVQYETFLAGYFERRGIPTGFHWKLRARVNGWFKMQARHKMSRSVIPHGRHTGPSRMQAWQVINAAIEAREKREAVDWPELTIGGHCHYFAQAMTRMGTVIVAPCWKGIGDRFGDMECEGAVDVGIIRIDVGETEEEGWTWRPRLHLARLEHRTVNL